MLELISRYSGLSGADLRSALTEGYAALVREYGEYAAVAAMEFYQEVRDAASLPVGYTATAYDVDDEGLLAYDVRSALGGKSPAQRLAGTAVQRVLERADETLTRNLDYDPSTAGKYALVPSAGACGWCRLLASNGFMYANEAKANRARHPNCKCTPIVDFSDSPELEGYDPDKYYDQYREAKTEIKKTSWEDWKALSQAERDKYKKKGKGAYDVFLRNRIAAYMSRL